MLGWHITVSRQARPSSRRPGKHAKDGARLAVWQADVAGLDWIDHLVHEGNAVSFGGNGYPMRYAARANGVIPVILGGPPLARALWQREAEDIVTPAWAGKTVIEQATIDACRPAEWLLIEAWDES